MAGFVHILPKIESKQPSIS